MDISNFTIEYDLKMDAVPKVFVKDTISIALCTSDQYSPYCGITIQSIISNSYNENFYDVFIMEYDISPRNKKLILSLIENKPNFSIRFINMKKVLNLIKIDTWAHFSVVACFKIFLMSNSFCEYSKMLVLDTDLIFEKDSAELFNIDISNYYMAAVDDVIMKMHISNEKKTSGFAPHMPVDTYIADYLGAGTAQKYYNTGVIVLNLMKCRKDKFLDEALFKLKTKGYNYQEQDVLNELCANHILDLNSKWNVVGTENADYIRKQLVGETKVIYENALDDPYVIHFAGGLKPWKNNDMPYSETFFKYAKHTPWYESILAALSINYINFMQKNTLEIFRYEQTFRYKVKKFALRILPVGSKRRQLVAKLFPRGSLLREALRKSYNAFVRGSIKTDFNNYLNSIKKYMKQSIYVHSLKKGLKKNYVLLDSKNGTDLAGNIFRIIEQLNQKDYSNLKVFLTYTKQNKARIGAILQQYNMQVTLIGWQSIRFYQLLARAKYVATDLYMPSQYIKRTNQVLISTAHGTPLKVMGRDCHSETQGHLQRTHTLADLQTFPSAYMKEKLFSGFMEDNLFTGSALQSGYIRNVIFFNKERRAQVREQLHYERKTVYAYLPTFRGAAGSFESNLQKQNIMEFFDFLDDELPEDFLLLVKLHNFNKLKLDTSNYKHIVSFPDNFEVYDVLNATDGLITDYSSVFFDYANLRKKIILFQYDFESYMENRGVYLTWDKLPFPIVYKVEDLLKEMLLPRNYDDSDFIKEYCRYDKPSAASDVCKHIFLDKNSCKTFETSRNNKKNIFIYAGTFDPRSPITYTVREYLKRLDKNKNNYFLYFYEYDLMQKAFRLESLPEKVNYISFLSYPDYTAGEKIGLRILPKKLRKKIESKIFKRECEKCFANLPIDLFVDLNGHNRIVAEVASNLKCPKIILHNEDSNIKEEELIKKYNTILSSDVDINSKYDNVVQLQSGCSQTILDENTKILEGLFNV